VRKDDRVGEEKKEGMRPKMGSNSPSRGKPSELKSGRKDLAVIALCDSVGTRGKVDARQTPRRQKRESL